MNFGRRLKAGAAIAAGCLMGAQASAGIVFDQGFEIDTAGWFDFNSTVTRVASGTGGITSASGGFHAVLANGDPQTGAYTFFGGPASSVWPNGFTASQDVYLDTGWSAGTGLDYTVAAYGSDGAHQRDFIFHITKDTSSGNLLVGGSNNTNFAPREDLDTLPNFYQVTSSGWYTLQHVFRDDGGSLAVDLNLLDAGGTTLFTETRFNPADTIPAAVGGNGYGWFTFNSIDRLAIDNTTLELGTQATVPAPATVLLLGLGCAALGLRRRRQRTL